MDYILVIVATVLLAFEFAFSKKYQNIAGVSIGAGLRFNSLAGLLSATVLWIISGFRLEWSAYSLVMALTMAVCLTAYGLISFQILKAGGMTLYTTFLMSGGMLLPYIFGVLFLDEPLTLMRVLGVMAVLAGVLLANLRWEKVGKKALLLCCAVFALNGCVSIFSKCHQITVTYPTVSSTSFAIYSSLGKCLFSSVALLFCKTNSVPVEKVRVLPVIAGAAIFSGVSYLLQLVGARTLPATALYPMFTGGAIIFSSIAGRVFFKEQLSRAQIGGIALCFIGTLLFL